MSGEIISISSKVSNSEFLKNEAEKFKKERRRYRKVIVIAVDDTDGDFEIYVNSNNVKSSAALSMIEVAKTAVLREMGQL